MSNVYFILGHRNVRQKMIHLVAITPALMEYIHSIGLVQNQMPWIWFSH